MLKTPVRAGALALGLIAMAPALAAEHVRASYYGGGEYLNRRTANGERFDPRALTCAHRSLSFGTRIRVAYRGRSVVVRVNDRGPARWTGRALDLSRGAAQAIGLIRAGVGVITINRL